MTRPSLSFIIPAHDEEALIARAIDGVLTAAYRLGRGFEVIVVDDGSTDRTAARAAACGARVVRIDRRQIAAARNAGAAVARGEVLIFVDADTTVYAAVIRAALNTLHEGAVGGGARLRFDEPVPRYAKAVLAALLRLYFRMGWAAGCFVFCRQTAFRAVGGFDEKLFAGEEIAMSRALARQGRFVILRETVLTSSRKLRTHSSREIFGTLAKGLILWPWMARRRLPLWYGPRRRDPASVV